MTLSLELLIVALEEHQTKLTVIYSHRSKIKSQILGLQSESTLCVSCLLDGNHNILFCFVFVFLICCSQQQKLSLSYQLKA